MPMKIKDPALKDKMMWYMKDKPEMKGIMPMTEEGGPAMETPEMHLEKMKPVFAWWSPEEKLSFIGGLLSGAIAKVEEPVIKTPAIV